MKYFNKIIYSIVLVSGLYGGSLQAQVISDYLTEVDYNTDIDYTNAHAINILHNQVMQDTIGTVVNSLSPANIVAIRGAKIDGYHQDSDGRQYFSFDADTRLGGASVLKSDIIRCNNSSCSTFSLVFDASSSEPFKQVNIDAFTFDPENGDLIFSIESAAIVDGFGYFPADLIRFDNSGIFSLEYDSLFGAGSIGATKNIDAVSLLPNGHYIISLANISNDVAPGGFRVLKSDVLAYYPPTQTWSFAYTPLSFGNAYHNVNVTSLMGFEDDLIYKNGFD